MTNRNQSALALGILLLSAFIAQLDLGSPPARADPRTVAGRAGSSDAIYLPYASRPIAVGDPLQWRCWSSSEANSCHLNLHSVAIRSGDDAWAVGSYGTIIRWDGVRWRRVTSPTTAHLRDVAIIAEDDVWVVGDEGTILRWDGAGWRSLALPSDHELRAHTQHDLRGVAAGSAADVWIVGAYGTIFHWTGTALERFDYIRDWDLQDVATINTNDAWAVGSKEPRSLESAVLHWDGRAWRPVPVAAPYGAFSSVSMISSEDGWAVAGSNILRWDGTDWLEVEHDTGIGFSSVVMIEPDSGWAVGQVADERGAVAQWDGERWSRVGLPEIDPGPMHAVAATAEGSAWVVGEHGERLRLKGGEWRSEADPPPMVELRAVSAAEPDDVWAVGGATDTDQALVRHWDGDTWSSIELAYHVLLNGVAVYSGGGGWAVGEEGLILRRHGDRWQPSDSPIGETLHDVFSVNANDAWAVGASGTIIRWNGSSWAPVESGTEAELNAIAMLTPDDGWAAGGVLLHWDGDRWTEACLRGGWTIYDLVFLGPSHGWAVGEEGAILCWDGTDWRLVASPTTTDLRSVSALRHDLAFAVGGEYPRGGRSGVLLVWDGSSWRNAETPPLSWQSLSWQPLYGVALTPDGSGWAVGRRHSVLRLGTSASTEQPPLPPPTPMPQATAAVPGHWGCLDDGSPDPCHHDLNAVSLASRSEGWAVGEDGVILRWDGVAWRRTQSPSYPLDLLDVAALGADDAWTGGAGHLFRWDGNRWDALDVAARWYEQYLSADVVSDNEVWFATGGESLRWDGQAWTRMKGGGVQRIDMISPTNGWSSGAWMGFPSLPDLTAPFPDPTFAALKRWDGCRWREVRSCSGYGDQCNAWALGMASATAGWAANRHELLHWDGAGWQEEPNSTGMPLHEIEPVSEREAWAVGYGGTILHWERDSWRRTDSPTQDSLAGVSLADPDYGWAVGSGGALLEWDGREWLERWGAPEAIAGELMSVSAVSASDVWAVGRATIYRGGAIAHWDGMSWRPFPYQEDSRLAAVAMVGPHDGWTVGEDGTVLRWNGQSWLHVEAPTEEDLHDIAVVSADDVWVVGDGGIILRWDGRRWSAVPCPVDRLLSSVAAARADDVWAGGDDAALVHWDGTVWTEFEAPLSSAYDLNDIEALAAGDVWLFGPNIYHWDGTRWARESEAYANAAWMSTEDGGWAVGDSGRLTHWDGRDWAPVTSPACFDYNAVTMVSDSDGWIVGADGSSRAAILRYYVR